MTLKRTSAANATPVRVVIVTLDNHLASATERARLTLMRELPGLELHLHAAADWDGEPDSLARCIRDIENGDIIIATMLFMEEHIRPVLPALRARRDHCDAMLCCMSAAEVVKLTRLGRFDMSAPQSGPLALLKRLRGRKEGQPAAGAQQMAMLRRLPKILRFIPGTAQDVRAYFLSLQYWLAGSQDNVANLVRMLVSRYAEGSREALRGALSAPPPVEYPEVGLYHPQLKERITDAPGKLPATPPKHCGTVGLLLMRSYLLAGNTAHYDSVITAFEGRGLKVVAAFASGLDARPAIQQFFTHEGKATVDALVSLTGFSLVGGPAYNDAKAAESILAELDVPYIAVNPLEFQTIEQWAASERGLLPVESTMMVAIPELDGATGSMVYGGRTGGSGEPCKGCRRGCTFHSDAQSRDMQICLERADMLAARVEHQIRLRITPRHQRNVAIVLFNFPPNAGNTGTAAFLSVFESLHRTLIAMREGGYKVEVPETVAALRDKIIEGNAKHYGATANVHKRIATDDHVRRERWLSEIETQWGPAPGKLQSDGGSIFILGEQFGNVFVGIQPGMGCEGDPMRLLFEKSFAPTHAFSAFYRYLREDFGAHALLHFGTHGALEFMPGKQAGLSGNCWPDRLIGDVPNFYLYASNNPSEGVIAKRRGAATLVSYLTPSIAQAGLYRDLIELKASIERWRKQTPEDHCDLEELAQLIQAQAAQLDLAPLEPAWTRDNAQEHVERLNAAILELEYTLIPNGLHIIGEPMSAAERIDTLLSIAEASVGARPDRALVEALVGGAEVSSILSDRKLDAEHETLLLKLQSVNALLAQDHELPALLHALDGRFVRPTPGGDLLRTPDVLPTGRNLHGFDPFRMPSTFAMKDGAKQAAKVLARHAAEGHALPETIAIVLWGTDNLKTEGGPIGQALALMGAIPRFDAYGRLCGASLIPLEELKRPRIDVVMTLSGIFRDLLPLQVRLLAEAAYLAAEADEPLEQNFIRKHTLAYQRAHGCDLETAALRVFSNADGAYGSNVNHLVDSSCWDDEDELAEVYTRRKCFAYNRYGHAAQQASLLKSVLGDVKLAYQNLDSVELGITSVDHYFDTLGGINRAVMRVQGAGVPVYIGDQTQGEGTVRLLSEQVALETRTRMLNPKWYEGMLKHGYEGVRQIELHVTNTMGWSATTGQVAPWVYQKLSETFVLDDAMRSRIAELNPTASARMANRLLEAHERQYWQPDASTIDALRRASDELEDRLEGVYQPVAA